MRKKLQWSSFTTVAVVLLSATICQAQSATNTPGRLLASNCAQCHGPNEAAAGFESLFGKSADKLFNELKEYQAGAEGEGIMAWHAWDYTDQQLRDIAQWLSKQR